jgi:hypothetical protein
MDVSLPQIGFLKVALPNAVASRNRATGVVGAVHVVAVQDPEKVTNPAWTVRWFGFSGLGKDPRNPM